MLIIPNALTGAAFALILPVSIEFICAQSPQIMKGLLVGLWFSTQGLFEIIGDNLNWPFTLFQTDVTPSCEFYYYLMKCLLLVITFLLYTVVAKWYKLRKRQTVYNANFVIAEYFERHFDQRKQLARQLAEESESVKVMEVDDKRYDYGSYHSHRGQSNHNQQELISIT